MSNPFMPQQPAGNPFAPTPGVQQPNPYQQQPAPQQYAPAPAPQYTQQPQQYAAAPAPAAPVPVATPGAYMAPPPPTESGSSNKPRIADLQSRLLIVMPEKVERQVPSNRAGFDPQDRMTCTVVVLDGGPLQWGGLTPNSQRMNEQVPYVIKGLWIRQTKLVSQLEDALALRLQGGPGLVLGRLWKTGTAQNDPYVLATPSPDDARLYDQYVSQVNPFSL
jgi:hypothetical protein